MKPVPLPRIGYVRPSPSSPPVTLNTKINPRMRKNKGRERGREREKKATHSRMEITRRYTEQDKHVSKIKNGTEPTILKV